MQVKFELVTYNEELDFFDLDENIYQLEINEDEIEKFKNLKSSDLELYNWLKESDSFLKYIKEEVYQSGENKKFAISDINGVSYRGFYFFKVTSSDSYYEYFKKLFGIHEESDWQDREDIGEEILQCLSTKRKELILNLG